MGISYAASYDRAVAITPSDSVNFDASISTSGQNVPCCDAIYVGTKGSTGTIVGVLQNGATVTIVGALAGTIYPLRLIRVNSTTTDASNLVALYQV